ncbi:hypothetical protein AVEN_38060-1 [Araneus ventricosus]|uniref:Uncharacterized protein n=1 Tax=Araneus ventricosus TaxID=182803 RepID=A0A4Y2IZI4_ARAVE|nr:hypothetical protein AVEN_38060-1 [Araneus ventricosus]
MSKVQDNPQISAPQIAADIKADYNIEVTPETERNAITKAGFNGRAVLASCRLACGSIEPGMPQRLGRRREKVLSLTKGMENKNYKNRDPDIRAGDLASDGLDSSQLREAIIKVAIIF